MSNKAWVWDARTPRLHAARRRGVGGRQVLTLSSRGELVEVETVDEVSRAPELFLADWYSDVRRFQDEQAGD